MNAQNRVGKKDGGNGISFWLSLFLLLGFAAFVRFYDLKADPPAFFAHGSQDLTTDGAYLTLHAKQAVIEGNWDLFGYKTWTPFKVSMVSGLSFLIFKLFGVSRISANATGGLLSLAGLVLFWLAFWRSRSRRFLLLLAFFLSTNYMLTVYSRVPFSENGLLFLAGSTFFVFSRWFDGLAGKIAVGVLIALCGLLGKSFGFLLGVGPVLCILSSPERAKIKNAAAFVLPMVITFIAFWLTFYRDQQFFTFLWEHGSGVHGYPHGFESPLGFLEGLVSYGRYGLHSYSIVISVICVLATLSLLVGRRPESPHKTTTLFMFSWIVTWIVVFAPFNYLPLRYFFVLVMPMGVVAATFLDELPGSEMGGFGKFVWWRITLLLFVNWLFVYYLFLPILAPARLNPEFYHAVWTVLPLAALLTVAQGLVFRTKRITITPFAAKITLITVVVFAISLEGYQHVQWLRERAYTVEYANDDVAALVGPEAVIAGQYGPAITAENQIRSFPYFVTDDTAEVGRILREYPVTHVAVEEHAWDEGIKNLAIFQNAQEVTRFWVRDAVVVLARVSTTPGGAGWHYKLTDFEQASLAISHHQTDSAQLYLKRFLTAHPNSRAGLANAYYWTLSSGPLAAQKPCVDRLVSDFPTDFAACLLGGIYYKWLGNSSGNPMDKSHSIELFERALYLNPIQTESIRRMYDSYRPDQPVM